MDNVKNDGYYLEKIITDLKFLIAHTKNLTSEEMKSNEILLDSIMFRLVQISENSNRLTDEFKKRNQQIPWSAIRGLRNRIVHDYGDVDLTVIYDAVKTDVTELLQYLNNI